MVEFLNTTGSLGTGYAVNRDLSVALFDLEPALFGKQQGQRPGVVGVEISSVVISARRNIYQPQSQISAIAIELRHDLLEGGAIEHQPSLPPGDGAFDIDVLVAPNNARVFHARHLAGR